MIIKLIHVGEADLKHVGCLIRLFEEREFMKSLRLEFLGDRLKSPTIRKLSYGLSYGFVLAVCRYLDATALY